MEPGIKGLRPPDDYGSNFQIVSKASRLGALRNSCVGFRRSWIVERLDTLEFLGIAEKHPVVYQAKAHHLRKLSTNKLLTAFIFEVELQPGLATKAVNMFNLTYLMIPI